MALVRTMIALLVALSVALLPAAGAGAFKLKSQDATEMSASDPEHDCCPPATDPCRNGDCGSMAACVSSCSIFASGVASTLAFPTMLADAMPLLSSWAGP